MGMSGLPDTCTRSPRAADPRVEGIFQVNHEYTLICNTSIHLMHGQVPSSSSVMYNGISIFIL